MKSNPHWIVQLRAAVYYARAVETATVKIEVGEFGFLVSGSLKIKANMMQYQKMVHFEEVELCSMNALVEAIDEVTAGLLREQAVARGYPGVVQAA